MYISVRVNCICNNNIFKIKRKDITTSKNEEEEQERLEANRSTSELNTGGGIEIRGLLSATTLVSSI